MIRLVAKFNDKFKRSAPVIPDASATETSSTPTMNKKSTDAWCQSALDALWKIRNGKISSSTEVGDIKLLERITYDEKTGTSYYHLNHRTRDLLRSGDSLPWGV